MWQLIISVNKCCVLNTGNPRLAVNVNIGNSALPQSSFVLDLGMTTTSNLSPSTHIRNIVCKANSRAIAIHRCFMSRDITLFSERDSRSRSQYAITRPGELNTRGVAKYSDFGRISGYISETVQDKT